MITCLIGPIASGKSTFCRLAASSDYLIVNDDAIVNSVHAGHYDRYDKKLKPLYKSVENQIITSAIQLGRNVIIDRPLHSISSRRRYIGLGHSLDVEVAALVFPRLYPDIHAQRRWRSDSRGYDFAYWQKVAHHHESLYEPPTYAEGFDHITPYSEAGRSPGVYLASRFDRRQELQGYRKVLSDAGVTVTSRWLDEQNTEGGGDRQMFAEHDLEDIRRADILLAFTEDPKIGYAKGGRHHEAGYAMALGKEIWVTPYAENIFLQMQQVRRFDSFDDVVAELKARAAG